MTKANKNIPEEIIYQIWINKEFDPVFTINGKISIEILDPGIQNSDYAGPDFQDSKIRIGEIIFNGDIEIDNSHKDWKQHGHHLNKRYNTVILHVVFTENSSIENVITEDGRKVYSINLSNNLSAPLRKTVLTKLKNLKSSNQFSITCSGINRDVNSNIKTSFIKELGLIRFRKKCDNSLRRLKELVVLKQLTLNEPVVKYDFASEINKRIFSSEDFMDMKIWQQLLYEQIFEALGYSKNKENMLKLSRSADINFLATLQQEKLNQNTVESILFNISGLIPLVTEIPDEDTSNYLRTIVTNWNEIKNSYDCEFLNGEIWNFFKLRPQNFPTIRIAAGSQILLLILKDDLISNLLKIVNENAAEKEIISMLRKLFMIEAKGFWSEYYNFSMKLDKSITYFIGSGRADEIIINIVLPFLVIYFDLFNQKEKSHKVLNVYLNYVQKGSNKLVDNMSDELEIGDMKLQSIIYQGIIELHKNYCTKQNCNNCEIGKVVFS